MRSMHSSAMSSLRDGRPVYVLGAGFSRAVHERMPLTDELGEAIRAELRHDWPSGYDGSSFEEQLTVLSTALPFLEGYENTARRALAERITAQLAKELEHRAALVTSDKAPLWLLQLVALWHAENATVLTFNYDTLVEHAVTTLRPVTIEGRSMDYVHGSRVVFPAPPPAATITFRDQHGPTTGSFRLLKLHGSLNWYWSVGDGNTLVRTPYIEGFSEEPDHRAAEFSGIRFLDRFLVPPVLAKDSYYNVNLIHMLWREAYESVVSARSLTIVGYSMPKGDRVAADLVRNLPSGAIADIVNYATGSVADPDSPIGRADAVGLQVGATYDGQHAVKEYVSCRLAAAVADLKDSPLIREPSGAAVVASVYVEGSNSSPRSFAIRMSESGPEGVEFLRSKAAEGNSVLELALSGLNASTTARDDFLDGPRFARTLDSDLPTIELAGRQYIPIAARRLRLGNEDVIELSTAPA